MRRFLGAHIVDSSAGRRKKIINIPVKEETGKENLSYKERKALLRV